MAVTSNIGKPSDIGSCLIRDRREADLLKPSAIKPAVSSIEQALVIKKLGALSPYDLNSLNAALKELLEL